MRVLGTLVLVPLAGFMGVIVFGCARNILLTSHRDSPIAVYAVIGAVAATLCAAALWTLRSLWRGGV
jgi:hypothetical protein